MEYIQVPLILPINIFNSSSSIPSLYNTNSASAHRHLHCWHLPVWLRDGQQRSLRLLSLREDVVRETAATPLSSQNPAKLAARSRCRAFLAQDLCQPCSFISVLAPPPPPFLPVGCHRKLVVSLTVGLVLTKK
eukprot:767241-Hanusia_phi.AAC.5